MKRAFTLAEVLVTLAIIGVVAVLTLPSLSNFYQKRVLTSQLQKSYADLSQAGSIAAANDQSTDDFRQSDTLKEGKFIGKFIKNTGSYSFAEEYGVYGCETCKEVLNLSGYDCGKLKTGASFCITRSGDGYLDVNSEKGPNQLGRDLFMIGYAADGSLAEYDHFLKRIIKADWDLDAAISTKQTSQNSDASEGKEKTGKKDKVKKKAVKG